MSTYTEFAERGRTVHATLASELDAIGGILRCTGGCGWERPLGDIGAKLQRGWPKCCGYTMRWVTQRELDTETQS